MDHIYIVGYWAPSDGKFQVSDICTTRPDAEIAFAYQDMRKPILKYVLVEGQIIKGGNSFDELTEVF